MKPITINVQITKCPKQYESIRLGMECSIDNDETAETAIKAATAELTRIYGEMVNPNEPQQDASATAGAETETETKKAERERLEFGDRRVQQIVNRIERQPDKAEYILQQTLKYFEPSKQVLQVLKLAANLA